MDFFNYPNVLCVGNLFVSKCISFIIIIIYIFSSIFDLMCLLSGEMQRQEGPGLKKIATILKKNWSPH